MWPPLQTVYTGKQTTESVSTWISHVHRRVSSRFLMQLHRSFSSRRKESRASGSDLDSREMFAFSNGFLFLSFCQSSRVLLSQQPRCCLLITPLSLPLFKSMFFCSLFYAERKEECVLSQPVPRNSVIQDFVVKGPYIV